MPTKKTLTAKHQVMQPKYKMQVAKDKTKYDRKKEKNLSKSETETT